MTGLLNILNLTHFCPPIKGLFATFNIVNVKNKKIEFKYINYVAFS